MSHYISGQDAKDKLNLRKCDTLHRWESYCPVLGRAIYTKCNGEKILFSRADVERIKKLTMTKPDRFDDQNGIWLPREMASLICRSSAITLSHWGENCPRLGRPIRRQLVRRKIGDVYRTVWVYFQADLEEIVMTDDPKYIGNRNWLTAKQAKALGGWNRYLLDRWENHCPVLGRGLETKPRGKKKRLYSHRDLERIKNLTMTRPDQYEDESGVWLTHNAVFVRFGFSRYLLRGWAKRCPVIGRPMQLMKVIRSMPSGTPFHTKTVKVYLLADLKAVKAALGKPLHIGDEWLTDSDAADEFGVTENSVERWARIGCPWLNGRKLRRRRLVVGRGERYYYSRIDLEEAAKNRNSSPMANGVYATIGELSKHKRQSQGTLYNWSKSCPYLGRPVRHRVEKHRLTNGRNQKVVMLHEGDVDLAIAARNEAAIQNDGWPTTKEVAQLCEVHPCTVRKWERCGCPFLNDQKLASEWRTRTNGAGCAKYKVFHPDYVKALVEALGKTLPESWEATKQKKSAKRISPNVSHEPTAPATRIGRPTKSERDRIIRKLASKENLTPAELTERLNDDKSFVKRYGEVTRGAVRGVLFRKKPKKKGAQKS